MEQLSVFTEITFWNMLNIFLWLLSGRVWSWINKLAGKSTVVQMWRMVKCGSASHIIVNFSIRETEKLKIKMHTCFESTNHTDAISLKKEFHYTSLIWSSSTLCAQPLSWCHTATLQGYCWEENMMQPTQGYSFNRESFIWNPLLLRIKL